MKNRRLYRFRPLHVLSDKSVVDELSAREIYLGTLEDNNDPMDGVQDVFWDGDEIVWWNFIRHYCFCLLNAVSLVSVAGDTVALDVNNVTARATEDDLPEAPIRKLLADFQAAVLNDAALGGLLRTLASRQRLTQDALRFVLAVYHTRILEVLSSVFDAHSHPNPLEQALRTARQKPWSEFEDAAREVEASHLSAFSRAGEHVDMQIKLINMYEHAQALAQHKTEKMNMVRILSDFPALYLEACVKGIFDEYYVSCFTERNDNESMWGHYASGHKGVCLVFEFAERDGGMQMELDEGVALSLHQVKYSAEPPQINVFESLGFVPGRSLHRNWLTREGRVSHLAAAYGAADYHSKYWNAFAQKVSHKFPEWAREQEVRAVKSAWFSGRAPANQRLLHYKMHHLKGIIFGMRMPLDYQLQIMRVLDETLSQTQKETFEFYRARYSPLNKRLDVARMDLLKFKPAKDEASKDA
jgi:hypothetical protein